MLTFTTVAQLYERGVLNLEQAVKFLVTYRNYSKDVAYAMLNTYVNTVRL